MILALLFLASALAIGLALARKLRLDAENNLAYAIPVGIVASAWILFFASLATGFGPLGVLAASGICFAAAWFLSAGKTAAEKLKLGLQGLLSKKIIPLAAISLALLLAVNYLAFRFDGGGVEGFPVDFGFHKSIISSIASGNFPPEHPLFAGKPLAYYYFTHLFTAALVSSGLSLQASAIIVNTLSIFSVALLIFLFTGKLFEREARKSALVQYLAVFLVFFNGSLAIVEYFKQTGFTLGREFFSQNFFNGLQEAYPFLNFLTAHLLLTPYAIALAILLIVAMKLLEGDAGWAIVFVGLLPMFNIFAFAAGVCLALAFLLYAMQKENGAKKTRGNWSLFALMLAIAIPQILFFIAARGMPAFYFKIGWLAPSQNPLSVAWFWVENLGVYLALGAAGYALASARQRKLLLAAVPLFIVGNLFIATPFAWDTGKLFLFFYVMLAIFAAFALERVFSKGIAWKALGLALVAAATVGGLLSAYTFATASASTTVYDSFDLKACEWVEKNTRPNALFLTDGQHSCIFGIEGRRVFLGDLEWIKNHGLDYTQQLEENNAMLAGDCALIRKKGIEFVYLDGYKPRHAWVNETFLREKLEPAYNTSGRVVYRVKC